MDQTDVDSFADINGGAQREVPLYHVELILIVCFADVCPRRACCPVQFRGMGCVQPQSMVPRPYHTHIHFDFGCLSFSFISQFLVHDTFFRLYDVWGGSLLNEWR